MISCVIPYIWSHFVYQHKHLKSSVLLALKDAKRHTFAYSDNLLIHLTIRFLQWTHNKINHNKINHEKINHNKINDESTSFNAIK